MTLDEIFAQDEAHHVPSSWPEVELEATEAVLRAAGHRLEEGRWTPSHIRGIYQRIDPARPEMGQRRHVHLSTKKHLSTPGRQVSWNDDGTRHDRHSFHDRFGSQRDVREVARVALGLPAGAVLEHRTKASSFFATVARSGLLEALSDPFQATGKVRLVCR